jgi:uncharacterized protein (TIGR02466 family)
MTTRTIYPLFSTPVYVNNVGEFPRPDLRALEYSSQAPTGNVYNFASSVDKNVLDRPAFSGVREIVMREINVYAREIMAVSDKIEFYITNSWINIHRRGQAAGPHVHNNSLLSGVLYLQVSETSGDLVFQREVLSLLPFPPALDLDIDRFNIYNCKSWGHRPKNNEIVIFPSVVMHSADANESDEERICLAFNAFVRGTFGPLHQLSIK